MPIVWKKDINDSSIISANKVSGTLAVANIPSLDAGKITTGTIGVSRIPNLATSKITGLTDSNGKITLGIIPDVSSKVSSVAANKVSGTLAVANIPSLDAGKITTGTIGVSRIPNLATSKITGLTDSNGKIALSVPVNKLLGTIDLDNIPDVSSKVSAVVASKINGVLDSDNIPSLDAGKITSGTIGVSRIPNLETNKITGLTDSSGKIALSVPVNKLLGTISINNIPDISSKVSSVAANKVSGTLAVANIPSLDASKITTGKISGNHLEIIDDQGVIKPENMIKIFETTTERDAYYTANPSSFVPGAKCMVGNDAFTAYGS